MILEDAMRALFSPSNQIKLSCYEWLQWEDEYIVRDPNTYLIVDEKKGEEVNASVLIDNIDSDWFQVRDKGE